MSETTGTELIRQAAKGRNLKLNLATAARDLGWPGDVLHNFIKGAELTPDQTRAICQYLLPHTVWDEATDRLMPAKRQEPTPQGVLPVLDPKLLPKYKPGACQTAPRLVNDHPPAPKPKRAGWLGGWI
jgi:hypothetical protein